MAGAHGWRPPDRVQDPDCLGGLAPKSHFISARTIKQDGGQVERAAENIEQSRETLAAQHPTVSNRWCAHRLVWSSSAARGCHLLFWSLEQPASLQQGG
jgi:hypothetical protein